MALNCCTVPRARLGFAGVTARETSVLDVATALLPLPLPPPQPEIARNDSNNIKSLFNRIEIYPRRYQARHIGSSPKIAHVAPCLNDNVVGDEALTPMSSSTFGFLLGSRVLVSVRAEQLRKVRVGIAVPGDAENDAGR